MSVEPVILAFLVLTFLVAAYAHTSAGLGGGSSYAALQSIAGLPAAVIPMISLPLNLLATTIGSYNYIRGGHFSWRRLAPFLLGSVPCAWLGGALPLPALAFHALLLASLLAVLGRMLFADRFAAAAHPSPGSGMRFWGIGIASGGVLGFVAGAVGIGGGIYLVPLIRFLGRGTPKQAAACGSVFIWINSLIGLTSRVFTKGWPEGIVPLLLTLLPTVALGAWFGSFHGALRWSQRGVLKAFGVVLVVACLLLARKIALLAGSA